MMTRGDGGLVGRIGRLFERGTVSGLDEGEILGRFAVDRDEAAFEALVARHGTAVLGVCRRFLRDPNDVDDAFQATFAILARKAGSIRDRDALGPWLHGVAFKVASRARAEAERRRRVESPDDRTISLAPAPDPGRPDLRWLLDDEILRLPDKLRLPVVLCLVEGRTYDEAARQLRWTSGMVRGRLAEARARLRDRLTRRGATPAVALGLVEAASSSVPPALVGSAVRVGLDALSGRLATSTALALADRATGGWPIGRFATTALATAAAGVALGVASMAFGPSPREQARADEPAARVQSPRTDRPDAKPPAPQVRRGAIDGSEIHTITVEGRALDRDGKPVAGASILITDANRSRAGDELLGRATAGADGRFVVRDVALPVLPPEPGPIVRPAEGKFEVAGSAPGFGFTWHAVQSYRPSPKAAGPQGERPGLAFHPGEPIVADLTFEPPARVRGRIIDDSGRPVAGAKVQFGWIDDPRKPGGSGMRGCVAVDPTGGDEPQFGGVGSLPEGVRATRTDADGRYEIATLPREVKLLALIDPGPTFDAEVLTVATSAAGLPDVRNLGQDGVLDHTFLRPVPVSIRVDGPAGVTLLAQGERIRRAGAVARTDANGVATLTLPPGRYTLRAEPPPGSTSLPREWTIQEDSFRSRPSAPPNPAVDLLPGAVVTLEAVDADKGRGIAGASFDSSADVSVDRREVQSRPGFVDHPTTDGSGQLKVLMEPGKVRFFPGRPPLGYEPVGTEGRWLTLKPEEPASSRFEFRKKSDPAEVGQPEEDETGRRALQLGQAQADKLRRGRMRATRTYQDGESIAPARLREILGSLDPDQVPPLLDLIRENFPDAKPASTGTLDVAFDGDRRRQEEGWSRGSKPGEVDVTVDNGRETISYHQGNAQVDIGDDGPKSGVRFGVAGPEEFCHWQGWGGKLVERAGRRVTLKAKFGESVARIVADESTGFIYRSTFGRADGSSGRDVWQFAPRMVDGGAIVPGLGVEHLYEDGKTSVVWLRTIESIDLGAPVPPETFRVSVPPGTMVLDYREGRDDTYRGVARRPITDVVAYADADPRRFKPFVPPVKVGDPAPRLDVRAWIGRSGPIEAPDLAGKVVLVDFWGVECGPCVAQMPEVRQAADHFVGKGGIVLVGLHDGSGTAEAVAGFASKRGLTWPIAIDRPGDGFGATFGAFGVRSIPHAAVIDRNGKLAYLGDFAGAFTRAASLLDRPE